MDWGKGGVKFLDVWNCRYRTQVGLPRFLSCKEKKRTVDAEQARSPDLPPDIPPLRSLTVFYNNSCDAENQHNRGYNMTGQGYLYSNRKLFRMVSDAGREIMRVYSWGESIFDTHCTTLPYSSGFWEKHWSAYETKSPSSLRRHISGSIGTKAATPEASRGIRDPMSQWNICLGCGELHKPWMVQNYPGWAWPQYCMLWVQARLYGPLSGTEHHDPLLR